MSSSRNSNSGGLWKTAAAVFGAASAAAFWYHHQQQQQQQQQPDDDKTTKSQSRNNNNNIDENKNKVNELVEQRFQACSTYMSHRIPKLPKDTQLEFYAWYKQATQGDASSATTKPPPVYDLVKRAKYQAWNKLQGMSKSSAMQHYIDKAMLVEFTAGVQGTSNDDDDDDDDDFEDAVMDIGGLGNKPSTLNYDDSDDNDDDDEGTNNAMFPLHKAAHDGNSKELQRLLLLQNNVDPNGVDASGQTALHLCADRGHLECMKLLINAPNANLNAGDKDGITSLHAAVISGHADACRLLLNAGADPDQEDRDGDTPRGCAEDDDDDAIQTVFHEFPRKKTTTSISSAKNGDDNYDIKDLDNIPMKFDEDDLDV
eukprot:scaffold22721_cov137-Cylindrotheca_fusiformis.AAC.4